MVRPALGVFVCEILGWDDEMRVGEGVGDFVSFTLGLDVDGVDGTRLDEMVGGDVSAILSTMIILPVSPSLVPSIDTDNPVASSHNPSSKES